MQQLIYRQASSQLNAILFYWLLQFLLLPGSTWGKFITCCFASYCFHFGINGSNSAVSYGYGSNDVYDFDTGVDKNKKESVVNLVGRLVSLKLVFIICLFSVPSVHVWINKNNLNRFLPRVEFGKPYRNLCCCLLMPCSRLHWADLGRYWGRKPAFSIVSHLCNYLRLYISGKSSCWYHNLVVAVKIFSLKLNINLIHRCCSVHHFGWAIRDWESLCVLQHLVLLPLLLFI